jgi:uncharacterized membrane protein
MNLRLPLVFSGIVITALCGLSLWVWPQLPAGESIAIHFAWDGTPNGYAGKAQGLFVLPAIALVITTFMALVPRLEPRRKHLAQSRGLYFSAWIGPLLLLAFGHIALVSRALGHGLPVGRVLPIVLALSWIVLGTQLGRCQSTFFAGIRTPWTLSSDYSWRRTHELAGRLFSATGGITLLVGFVRNAAALPVLVVCTIATGAISTAASYFFWRQDR